MLQVIGSVFDSACPSEPCDLGNYNGIKVLDLDSLFSSAGSLLRQHATSTLTLTSGPNLWRHSFDAKMLTEM